MTNQSSEPLPHHCTNNITKRNPESALHTLLSPREQEIVRLVAIGYPNKTIAGILEISPWTVATHVRRIFNKLGVRGRAAMIARLARAGFSFETANPRPTASPEHPNQ